MADAERCVCCGSILPEGRQVCPNCEAAWSRWENKRYYKRRSLKMKILNFLTEWRVPLLMLACAALIITFLCIAVVAVNEPDEEIPAPTRSDEQMEPLKEENLEAALRAAIVSEPPHSGAVIYPYECGESVLDGMAQPVEPAAITEYIAVPALGWGATETELEMAARIVWLEARGESAVTQRCVAEVIFNRLRSGVWGGSLTDVIFAADQNGNPEFSTAEHIWEAELDPGMLEMVKNVFYNGCRLPRRILYFRADHYHTWNGAVDEFCSDNTYFSSSGWIGEPDDGEV